MSTDWHVHCVDCNVTERLDNGRCDTVLALIRHAEAVAALDDLIMDGHDFALRAIGGWEVSTGWFRQHLGHQLLPIDEYGALLGQCHQRIACGECGISSHRCGLERDHNGPCRRGTG